MDRIERRAGSVTYTDPFPLLQRVILFCFGLVPLAAPYELLVRPAWQEGSFVFAVIPVLISLGAVAVGIIFVLGAFLGVEQQVTFDSSLGTVIRRSRPGIGGLREQRYPFAAVERVDIWTHDWSEGPTTYSLVLTVARGEKINFGRFGTKEEAEHEKNEIVQLFKGVLSFK